MKTYCFRALYDSWRLSQIWEEKEFDIWLAEKTKGEDIIVEFPYYKELIKNNDTTNTNNVQMPEKSGLQSKGTKGAVLEDTGKGEIQPEKRCCCS